MSNTYLEEQSISVIKDLLVKSSWENVFNPWDQKSFLKKTANTVPQSYSFGEINLMIGIRRNLDPVIELLEFYPK